MEFINKSNSAAANDIIDRYLTWAKNHHCEESNLYSSLGEHKLDERSCKDLLIYNVLLPEQHNRCCYCMRRLHDGVGITIEHIIPQSISRLEDLNRYFEKGLNGLDQSKLCLTTDFFSNNCVFPPYPLKVAYYNFAASCHSSDHCNNYRQNQHIEPLFLMPNINSEVLYDPISGEGTWHNDPINQDVNSLELPTLEKVGLNNSTLKIYRAFWGYLYRHNISYDDAASNNRAILLYDLLGDILEYDNNVDSDMLTAIINLQKDLYWNRIRDYDYFFQWFSSH